MEKSKWECEGGDVKAGASGRGLPGGGVRAGQPLWSVILAGGYAS